MLKLSKTNIQPQQTDASRLVSSMMPQQYNATPIKTAIEALDLPERVEANTVDTSNVIGFSSNTPSLESVFKNLTPSTTPTFTSNGVNRKINLPSYIPSDTPAGLISRDDWENYDDVNFYVGTDGKYHSTEPFFERMFWRESKNNLNAVDKKKLHLGPAQFDEGTWRRVMPGVDVSYRTNADYAGKAAANYAGINARTLRKAGVPRNAATIYGAHNLGAGTIINMYKNLDAPLTGQDLNFVLDNFNDAKEHAPELYKKYIRDPNSITGRDYMNLINAIFTN